MFKKKYVVFVLGAPGVGKNTICVKVREDYDVEHISPGQVYQTEQDTKNVQTIQKCLDEGKAVPAKITVKLIEKAIKASKKNKFIIDGFPRNTENRKYWDSSMGRNIVVNFVLFLDCPVDVCLQRCLSKKPEDNPEVLQKRIQKYLEDTNPLLEYYGGKSLLKTANGAKNARDIYNDVRIFFENFNKLK